jgi:hypothetical protein
MSRLCTIAIALLSLTIPALAQTTGAGDNMLTQDEREAGFRLLLDGQTLEGWEGGDCWSVQDGMIVGRNDGTAPTNYLWTKESFGDFVLRASCRLEGGNSGIQYRSQRRDDGEAIGYQEDMDDVRDPAAHSWWGCLYEAAGRGTMVDGWVGLAQTVVRMGAWNECEIICQGDHIIQRVNGVTCVDIKDSAASKGRFALQVHANLKMAAYFKNIRVHALEPNELPPVGEPGVPAGWTPLFTGKDLSNFDVIGAPEAYTIAADGVLRSEGGKSGDWLRSKRQYSDFVLHVEWRVSPGGNSGVFVRSAAEGAPWETGHECQISNEQPPRDDLHCTGTLYGTVPATPRPDETPEVWRTYEIHCVGPLITVIVDDTRTVDVDSREVDAIRGKPTVGYVGLQDSHTAAGFWIEYRNVWIKELKRAEGT